MDNLISIPAEHSAIVDAIKNSLESTPGLILAFPFKSSQSIINLLCEDPKLHWDVRNFVDKSSFCVSLRNVVGSDVWVVEKFDVTKETRLKWHAEKNLYTNPDGSVGENFYGQIQLINGNSVVLDQILTEKEFFPVCEKFGYKDFKHSKVIKKIYKNICENIYSYKGEGPVTGGPRLVPQNVQQQPAITCKCTECEQRAKADE